MEAHAADAGHALADAAVAASFADRIRELEDEHLSPAATRSYPPQRAREEAPCRLRTPFVKMETELKKLLAIPDEGAIVPWHIVWVHIIGRGAKKRR